MIEKAMKECHVALKPNRNAKQQVRLEVGAKTNQMSPTDEIECITLIVMLTCSP